jgi:hypothetical protein
MKTMNFPSLLQQIFINFGESRQTGGELLHLDLIFADYFEMRGFDDVIKSIHHL